jgi:3-(3-hydroxy-phenyl)propionate hydroxylase
LSARQHELAVEKLQLMRVCEYTFRAQVADRWRDRHVFILGDAAHLTPPFIGQGLCSGLRDSVNLAWKIAGVLNKDLPDGVLDTYEQERKPHARALVHLAVRVGWAMTGGGRLGNLLRRILVPWLQRRAGAGAEEAASSATPALRASALVIRSLRPGELAGTLCPNPVVAEESRFDDVVGRRFALVTSSPLTNAQHDQLGRRGAVVIPATPDGDLGRWLHRGRARARSSGPTAPSCKPGETWTHCVQRYRHSPHQPHIRQETADDDRRSRGPASSQSRTSRPGDETGAAVALRPQLTIR